MIERQRAEGGKIGDPFAEYDAAYVLGSLSPQDRHEFEAHLKGCRQCTVAVAALAGLPGLLSTVSATDAERIAELGADATPPVPETLRPRLLTSVRNRRRLRTVIQVTAAGLVAAACLVLGLFIARPPAAPVPDVTVAMQGRTMRRRWTSPSRCAKWAGAPGCGEVQLPRPGRRVLAAPIG